jgi:hypothetical protein
MEQITLKTSISSIPGERTFSWNPQKYFVDNVLLSLGITFVSLSLTAKFFGFDSLEVFFMITSQVHFGVSYLFHYNVLRRTLTTRKKKLFFFLTFFPLIVIFPIIYYGWVPIQYRGFPFMVYFIIHMIRDEHVFYVQRSSDFKHTRLDKKVQAHGIFTILVFIALLYTNYTNGLVPPSEYDRAAFYRDLPSWGFYVLLGVALIWGISSFYRIHQGEEHPFLRRAAYTSGIIGLILLYNQFIVSSISASRFNRIVIFYHYITWYLFGIERVLYYQSQGSELRSQGLNSLTRVQPPANYQGDPFGKFKHSPSHFLGLLLLANLFFLALYGLSHLQPFQSLNVLFNVDYIALWSFPHITLHFYPKR